MQRVEVDGRLLQAAGGDQRSSELDLQGAIIGRVGEGGAKTLDRGLRLAVAQGRFAALLPSLLKPEAVSGEGVKEAIGDKGEQDDERQQR